MTFCTGQGLLAQMCGREGAAGQYGAGQKGERCSSEAIHRWAARSVSAIKALLVLQMICSPYVCVYVYVYVCVS